MDSILEKLLFYQFITLVLWGQLSTASVLYQPCNRWPGAAAHTLFWLTGYKAAGSSPSAYKICSMHHCFMFRLIPRFKKVSGKFLKLAPDKFFWLALCTFPLLKNRYALVKVRNHQNSLFSRLTDLCFFRMQHRRRMGGHMAWTYTTLLKASKQMEHKHKQSTDHPCKKQAWDELLSLIKWEKQDAFSILLPLLAAHWYANQEVHFSRMCCILLNLQKTSNCSNILSLELQLLFKFLILIKHLEKHLRQLTGQQLFRAHARKSLIPSHSHILPEGYFKLNFGYI